jgi:hypothetical protein
LKSVFNPFSFKGRPAQVIVSGMEIAGQSIPLDGRIAVSGQSVKMLMTRIFRLFFNFS